MNNKSTPTKLTPLLSIACFALASASLAVSPRPDGGYPNQNTAEGEDALFSLRSGAGNTAVGYHALYSATIGGINTAVGTEALENDTEGYQNSAVGNWALKSNTTGNYNTALGHAALLSNKTGTNNTALGWGSMTENTTGSYNIAIGVSVLSYSNGSFNIAMGENAMFSNTSGDEDIAIGYLALTANSTGANNIAIGSNAVDTLTAGSNNVGIGFEALSRAFGKASRNIALGYQAGMNLGRGSNNICIGDVGVFEDENTTRIGNVRTTNTYIAGISGVTVAGGIGVVIDSSGHLGTATSSARYKENIQPMNKASEAILSLQPVTFHYKHGLDPAGIPQFGLVAEEVAKVNPDLVARDEQGKPYTVRYEAVNAMLLNEFLKEHRKVEEEASRNRDQEATIKGLKSTIAELKAAANKQAALLAQQHMAITTLTSQVQKVSAALDRTTPALLVTNNQ